MPADRFAAIDREVQPHHRGQLFGDVIVHPVVLRPRFPLRVEIEAGAGAEIVAVVFAGQIQAARAGIRTHDRDAELGSHPLRAGLLHEVLVVAGQTGEPPYQRHPALFGLRRQIDRENHVAIQRPRVMLVALDPAIEALGGRDELQLFAHRHDALLGFLSMHPDTGAYSPCAPEPAPTLHAPQNRALALLICARSPWLVAQKCRTVRMLLPACSRSKASLI